MIEKTPWGTFVGSEEDYRAFVTEMERRNGKTDSKPSEPVEREIEASSPNSTGRRTQTKTTRKK